MIKKCMVCLMLIVMFSITAQAETEEMLLQDYYDLQELTRAVESLDEDTKSILSRWGLSVESVLNGQEVDWKAMGQVVSQLLVNSIKSPLTSVTACLGTVILCATLRAVSSDSASTIHGISEYFSTLCLGVVLIGPITQLFAKTTDIIGSVATFMLALIPVLAGLLLASGQTLTAGSVPSALYACSQAMIWLSRSVVLPFTGAYVALSVSRGIGGFSLNGMVNSVKRITVWVLGGATALFSGVLCLSGVINGSADSIAQRASRFAVGNMVPVIGGSLAEALSAFRGCFQLLGTSGGVLGIGGVAALLLPVVIELILWRFMLMLLYSVAEIFQLPSAVGVIRGIADGVGIMFSVTICTFLVYGVGLAVMMLAGGKV
ncbi:MAG: hypothetical protein IJP35_05670 [Clostridia bacterium]|nr:hypothetical protein [Clostridia bacterium]